jgi:hypothetical protein
MGSKQRRSSYFGRQIRGLGTSVLGVICAGCIDAAPDEAGAGAGEIPKYSHNLTMARMELDAPSADGVLTAGVCSSGTYRCLAHIQATASGFARPFATPAGFGAADLQAAYKVPSNLGVAPTIAIVVAYGYPELEADLAVYRTQYGLPACTTANSCLKIVNQTGATAPLPAPPPPTDDWTLETALDIDMASAACPKCKLLVVQVNDNLGNGLFIGQGAAANLGANVISNSWGGPEQPGQSLAAFEAALSNSGITTFAAAGDNGYNDAGRGPDYPATSAKVIAVGGTTLVKDQSARGYSETAWANGGSACSLSIPKPTYQTNTGCNFKATVDVAAVGNPQTGVAVYNSRNGGWQILGGTSAASPFVAGLFAATGNASKVSGEFLKANAGRFFDVTSGSNGTCSSPILCTAGVGWDGPTGYGTPNASAFISPNAVSPGDNDVLNTRDVIGGCAIGGARSGLATVLVLIALLGRGRRCPGARPRIFS